LLQHQETWAAKHSRLSKTDQVIISCSYPAPGEIFLTRNNQVLAAFKYPSLHTQSNQGLVLQVVTWPCRCKEGFVGCRHRQTLPVVWGAELRSQPAWFVCSDPACLQILPLM